MQDSSVRLLHLLNRTGFHSGTDLGKALGISRVAVQKKIRQLSEQGLPVQAVHGRGYRLKPGVVLLEKNKIASYWSARTAKRIRNFEVLQSVDSTNDHLAKQIIPQDGACVCVAEIQADGRGRRGNDWHALPYHNVTLSLGWRFQRWPETITGLGLAAALVVAERLNALYDLSIKIKWPNDLLVNGAKLAGILVDVRGETGGECQTVLGIGLNVDQPHQERADYPWQDLVSLGCQPDRNQIAAIVVEEWISMLLDFSANGFAPYTQRWNQSSCYADQVIRVQSGGVQQIGKMRGVDETGALLLTDEFGEMHRIVDSMARVRVQ